MLDKKATALVVVAALALGAILGGWGAYRYAEAQGDARYAELENSISQAALTGSRDSDRVEDKLQEQGENQNVVDRQAYDAVKADYTASADANRRLRAELDRLRSTSATDSAFARQREGISGGDPIGVFANLLGKHGQELERISLYADRLKVSGLSCEARYDSVVKEVGALRSKILTTGT